MTTFVSETITIYNKRAIGGVPPSPPTTRWDRTVIKGAQWEIQVKTNQDSQGKTTIDKVVQAIINKDADTGNKAYISPQDYAKLPADDLDHWTLGQGDIIVHGECTAEVTSPYTITSLRNDYPSMEIRGVEDFTLVNILPHWEIYGV
jgi:hypothetical protein